MDEQNPMVFNDENLLPLISSSAVLRKEKIFRKLIQKAKERNIPQKKIYESLLQIYLFAGFPAALNSLKILKEFYEQNLSYKNNRTEKEIIKNGIRICKKIYGEKYNKLIKNVNEFSPELSRWLISEGYGKVLSRKGLSLTERELSIVAVLIVLKYKEQLYSHFNGAFRLKIPQDRIKGLINDLSILGKNHSNYGVKILNYYLKSKNRNQKNIL